VAWGQVYRIKDKDKCLTPINTDRSTDQEQTTTNNGLKQTTAKEEADSLRECQTKEQTTARSRTNTEILAAPE
jgi:hypothetical protein